jgi:hypothetical protein
MIHIIVHSLITWFSAHLARVRSRFFYISKSNHSKKFFRGSYCRWLRFLSPMKKVFCIILQQTLYFTILWGIASWPYQPLSTRIKFVRCLCFEEWFPCVWPHSWREIHTLFNIRLIFGLASLMLYLIDCVWKCWFLTFAPIWLVIPRQGLKPDTKFAHFALR